MNENAAVTVQFFLQSIYNTCMLLRFHINMVYGSIIKGN